MRKGIQRLTSVLLALCMLGAVTLSLGVAEEPATKTDLAQATEAPTEEPPVLVEEEVEPPMMLASSGNVVDPAQYGLTTTDGVCTLGVSNQLYLSNGTFTAQSGITGTMLNVIVDSDATLNFYGSTGFGTSLTVNGTLYLKAGSSVDSVWIDAGGQLYDEGGSCSWMQVKGAATICGEVNRMYVIGGTATINSSSRISFLNIESGATAEINDGASATFTTVDGSTLRANNVTSMSLGLTNASGEISGGSIGTLTDKGGNNFTTSSTKINKISTSNQQSIVENLAAKKIELLEGGTAPLTVRYPENTTDSVSLSYGDLTLNNFNTGENIYFEFTLQGDETISSSEKKRTYDVKANLGDGEFTTTVDVPVKQLLTFGGCIVNKDYDGTADFTNKEILPKWLKKDGTDSNLSLPCIVSGSTPGTDCGVYQDVACTISIEGQNWPNNVALASTEGKVDVEVRPRPLDIGIQDVTIAFGDDLMEAMHPEWTNEGLLSNHQIAVTRMVIFSESDPQNPIDSYGLEYQPGNYTIQYSVEVIESDTQNDVSLNYDLRPSTCTLTVSEPTNTFTVTIPATASVNQGEMRIEYRIDGTFGLNLTVSSENDWELRADGKQPIAYTLKDGGDTPGDQGYFLGYQERNLLLFLTPTLVGNPDPGTYEDTLTFTVQAYEN